MKKLMRVMEIAEALNINPSTFYRWVTGVRTLSANDAIDLERVTGVKAEAWVFPEKYRNPYFHRRTMEPKK